MRYARLLENINFGTVRYSVLLFLFLVFVLIHFILGLFGLAFTPFLSNI